MINDAGTSVKLITVRDCRIYDRPDSTESDTAPCEVFRYWYVLPPDRTAPSRALKDLDSITLNGFYRVAAGDTEGEFKGWIHKSDAIEWHHRQAVRFSPRRARDLAYFFPAPEDAVAWATNGEAKTATHREPESTGGQLVLMPLLDADPIGINGAEMELFKVAFVWGHTGSEAPLPTKSVVLEETTVDIVFVLDTTESMGPSIAKVLRSIEQVAETLASDDTMRPRLRLGLVGYRDTVGDMTDYYLTKTFCTLEEGSDHRLFIERLKGAVTPTGSHRDDYAEDVLAGIDHALGEHMKWNPYAWKNIIVVSDSSIKEPDHPHPESRHNAGSRTIAGLLSKVQPGSGAVEELLSSGHVISSVCVRHPDSPDDYNAADRQFRELTTGRSYEGQLMRVRGGSDPEDFSDILSRRVLKLVENFERGVLHGEPVKEEDWPLPVLDLLTALGDADSTGAASGKADTMGFASRFCAEFNHNGDRVFIPHVFTRKGQLLQFNSMLEYLEGALEDAGEPGSKDVATILRSLQVVSTSLNLAEPITADMELEKLLKLLLGLPLKTPIFRISISDLASMSQVDYDDWLKSVRGCHDTLESLLENPTIWYRLHPTARDREMHAFIELADLP
ncbi:MAG: vWA domain-containing protein [Candidatus Eisenbacteria bacterium]